MKYRASNIYFFRYINKIGGIESHLYYIARTYGKYDILVVYKNGDINQAKRLGQYVRVVKYQNGDTFECENLFCCFNRDALDFTKAERKFLVIHGDYKAMIEQGQLARSQLPMDDRFTDYIGVSQTVCDSWKELTGIEAKNVYQPVFIEKKDRPLLFCTASRLSREKGWERMKKLSKAMDDAGINYQWLVYTDSPKEQMDNILFVKPRLDITSKLRSFDAYIQLSDNEGYCLSVVEALKQSVPVIVTDIPVFDELDLNEENSVKIGLKMDDIPIDDIRNIRKKKFKYKEPEDKWSEVLIESSSKLNEKIKVRATSFYINHRMIDSYLGRIPDPDEEWEIPQSRLDEIQAYEKRIGAKLVEEQR